MDTPFEGVTSVLEANSVYRREFLLRGIEPFGTEAMAFAELHRKALELLTYGAKVVAEDDPNKLPTLVVQNWAKHKGLTLGKRGVPLEVENAYRRAHDLPVLREEKLSVKVRTWARENEILVPSAGRIPPDVMAAYNGAQKLEEI